MSKAISTMYRISFHDTSIYAHLNGEMVEAICKVVEPFFTVNRVDSAPDDSWVLKPASSVSDIGRYEKYVVELRGEKETYLFVDMARKSVAVPDRQRAPQFAQDMLRVSRDLLKLEAFYKGHVFLHAGLIDVGGFGIVLAGPSRSGKTTISLALAERGDAAIVSNDDLSLEVHANEIVGYGWPRSTSIRLDTFSAIHSDVYKDNKHRFEHPGNSTILSLKEEGLEKHGTVLLYPYELEKYFGFDYKLHCNAAVLVFPRFSNRNQCTLELMNDQQAFSAITENTIPNPAVYRPFLMQKDQKYKDAGAGCGLRMSIPCYQLEHSFQNVEETISALRELAGLPN